MLQKKTQRNNPHWPQIPDYLHTILIIRGSGSGKTNASLNLINSQPDIDISFIR